MKKAAKISFIIFFLLSFYGCTPNVYTVTGWETGNIINLKFAKNVVLVEDYKFETYVRHQLGYVAPFNKVIVKGNVSKCLISELKGVLPGYAVVNELKEVNPDAEIITVKPIDVDFKKTFSQKFAATIKVEVKTKGKIETVSAKGEGKNYKDSLTNACENTAEKIQKLIIEQKQEVNYAAQTNF